MSLATHHVFTDEASYNYGRLRGVGMVSLPAAAVPAGAEALRASLCASGMTECKWEKVRTARGSFAATKLLSWAIDEALADRLHVDTLTWNAGLDGGNKGIPALRKLFQMYGHLLGEILPQRWMAGSSFAVFPDEQNALCWSELVAGQPHIVSIAAGSSLAMPLIQLADLVTGLAVFSRARFDVYQQWLADAPDTRDLPTGSLSAADRVRCRLLDDFYTTSKFKGMRVSLRTHGGLRTYGAAHPFCFWWG